MFQERHGDRGKELGALRPTHVTELSRAENLSAYLNLVLAKRQVPEDEWIFRGQRDGSIDPTPKEVDPSKLPTGVGALDDMIRSLLC